MKIGIPRALLYYRYHHLWETFFQELGCEVIISPKTKKEMLQIGNNYAIDEACLSYKIYLGHVEWLIDKCDYILVPRIATYKEREIVCTRFQAAYDVIQNTFRDRHVKLLDYNLDVCHHQTEINGFLEMGKKLGKKKKDILRAYHIAKSRQDTYDQMQLKEQYQKLQDDNNLKLLIVAHPYNIYDDYIGKPIIDYLQELGCTPIFASLVPKETASNLAHQISPTLQWTYNKEMLGAIPLYFDHIDGIILMSSFPCGPDSLVNEMIIRRIKGKPILTLTLDMQDGTAGRETRLESFVDIIRIKKEER